MENSQDRAAHRAHGLCLTDLWPTCCRMLLEAMVILLVLPISERPPQPKILRGTEADCRQWDWAGVCKYTPLTDWPAIGISVFSGAYSWIHTTHIVKTHWQLESRLFKDTRAARVLWSIQVDIYTLMYIHACS